MNTPTPNARTLFGQALEIDAPAERAAFLNRACGADRALRAEVEALLHALAPAAGTVNHTYLGEAPGGQVGPYKLLQAIGEGGMGVVFLAEQIEPVRRQVALKVIKPGMDSAQVIARFEAERQALALMDHPHIARVLDAGATAAGRPFFVMELVRGVPITRYCDELHLDLRQRLELFVPVCQAIQHAHQKGVIHRDVKPSNILVCLQDGKPVPKVIDFGVAKAIDQRLTEKTLWTQFGAMVGTLEYMSPEQAELSPLGIDTRSDVYSLGVLLYELLTGTTPLSRKRLREAGHEEVVRLIKEEEPPRPSTRLSSSDTLPTVAAARRTEAGRLAKQVRGELDWIVMKALEKDRTRRYETANGLARDVERYLADEPVEACPPSATYRLRKFARKHFRVLATATAFVVLLLAGTALSAWLAVRATEAEQEAQTALGRIAGEQRKTQTALTDATGAKARTLAAMNALTDDVIEQLLTRQAQLGTPEKAFLRKVQGFYEEFAAERGHTEEARQTVAQGQFRLSRIHYLLGERAAAETALHAAVPLLEKLMADFPANPSHRLTLALCFNNLGVHCKLQGKYREAEVACRRCIQHFAKLVADFPNAPEYPPRLADASSDLAMVLDTLGKREEAEAVLGQALDQLQRLPAGFLTAADVSRYRVHGYVNLGDLLSGVGKRVESERAYRRAISLGKKLTAAFPTDPEHRRWLAGSYQHLGALLTSLPRRAAAETACRQALALNEGLVAEFPAVPNYRLNLAVSLHSLARVLGEMGKQAEAEAIFGRAIALQEKLVAAFPALPDYRVELASSHAALGMLFGRRRILPEAEKSSRRAIALHEKLVAGYPGVVEYRRKLAASLRQFASILREAGKTAEARAAYRRAIALNEKLAADFPARPDHRFELARCCHLLGAVLANEGKHAEAETSVRRAIAMQEKLAADFPARPSYRRTLSQSSFHLGTILLMRGQLAKAEAALRRAIALSEKLPADPNYLADDRRELFLSQVSLVYVLLPQNRHAEIAAALKEVAALHDKLTKDLSDDVVHRDDLASSHHLLARLMQDMGMLEAAAGAYQQAIAVREKLAADFPTVPAHRDHLATSLNNLGNVLLKDLRRLPDAEAVFRRGIALQEKLAAEFPTEARYRVALAGSYVNLGLVRMVRGQPLDSLDWYGKAIALLGPLAAGQSRASHARQFLRNVHRNQARALADLGRHAESARNWGRAAELDDGPKRRDSQINRARSLARAGDHGRAVALVTELSQGDRATGAELYDLAGACALSAAAAKEDAGLREQYAARAVALLRRARAAGYFQASGRVAHLPKDADLEALRQRPDFGKFLAELKAAGTR